MGKRRSTNDEASASMVSYTVAAAVFLVGSSVLFGFVVEPPGASTANLEQLDLRTQGTTALEVLLGGPGLPATWEGTAADIDSVDRLGLIEPGTTIRINADKFDALARGKYAVASASNGYVDYAEAKLALGLDGYEFHLRAYPLLSPGADETYGTEGMDDFRIAYVAETDEDGDPTATALEEIAALSALDIEFDDTVRADDNEGDVFADDSHDLRDFLLPNLGASVTQSVLSGGSGNPKYSFARIPEEVHADLTLGDMDGALALSYDASGDSAPDTIGYTKNRELRAMVGGFDVPDGASELTIGWEEWVDTDRGNGTYDCGDYGYAEYSIDNGETWTLLSEDVSDRSTDCSSVLPLITPFGNIPQERSFDVDVDCDAAAGEDTCEVLLAFHWIGDNDNTAGYGWLVDDVLVTERAGPTIFRKSFETPEYDMLIVGSSADHSGFTPNEMKSGIRDYVDEYGGRLLVLGGQEDIGDIQWLDRLFAVGIGGGSGGLAVPDTTHPLLTLPNELDYDEYPAPADLFTLDDAEAELFSMIIGESENAQALAVAREGAFGSGTSTDGSVMLSAYMPHEFDAAETARFFANAVVYGKYHYLYLEVGPPIPEGEAIASASRSATMNMYRTGDPEYTEMAFIMYTWPGQTAAATLSDTLVEASAPLNIEATASGPNVILTWEEPYTFGTGELLRYEILHGTDLSPTDVLDSVDAGEDLDYTHVGGELGAMHYYAVRAVTDIEDSVEVVEEAFGTHSDVVSAMPVALPAALDAPSVTPAIGGVDLAWDDAWATTTGNIYGYGIYESTDGSTYTLATEVGNTTSFEYITPDSTPRTYKVAAYNARGYGPQSAASASAAPLADLPGPLVSVTALVGGELTLTWVAPDAGAYTITGYRIYRADAEEGTYTELGSTGVVLTYEDTGLDPAEDYWYKLRAITTDGDGSYSDAAGATTYDVPDAPVLAGATANALTTLTWTAPASESPITSYEIYKGTTATSTPEFVASTGLLTWSGLFDSTKPYFRVYAVSAAGAGDWSNGVDVSAPPVDPPVVVVTALTPGNLTLSWTEPANLFGQTISGYNVYRATSAGGTYTLLYTTSGNRSYVDVGLGASTSRYYRVSAVTTDGEGTLSTATGGTTMAVPGAPVLVATRLLSTATLTWTAPLSDDTIVRYDIYKGSSSGNVNTFVKSVNGVTLTTTDSYSSSSKWYTVVAVSAAGAGAASNADDAST